MAGRTALATPTDVNLRNGKVVSIDSDNQIVLSFTNWCDTLAYCTVSIFNCTNNKLVKKTVYRWFNDGKYAWQKGSVPKIFINASGDDDGAVLYTGKHYKLSLILYANMADITGAFQNIPNCCVPYASGKIEWAQNYHQFKIATGIPKLEAPSEWGDTGDIIGCTKMRIGDEERMVVDYDSTTGMVTVEADFSTDVADNINNAQYFLNCNFISTSGSETEGSYDFYIRDEVQTVTETTPCPLGLRVTNTYFHPNSVGLENYRMRLYQTEGNTTMSGTIQAKTSDTEAYVDSKNILIGIEIEQNIVGKKIIIERIVGSHSGTVDEGYSSTIINYNSEYGIATLAYPLPVVPETGAKYSIYLGEDTLIGDSGEIYSYDLGYNFPQYVLGEDINVETTLTTYEKQQLTITKHIKVDMPTQDSPITGHNIIVDGENQNVVIGLTGQSSLVHFDTDGYNVFRREVGDYLWGRLGFIPIGTVMQYIDYTAGNNREYEYLISRTIKEVPTYVPEDNYKPYTIIPVKTAWDGWTITSIHPYTGYLEKYGRAEMAFGKYVRHLSKEKVRTASDISAYSFVFAKEPYVVGETWHFISEIDSGDIAHNLGLNVHVGTSAYPTVTRTNNIYQSGTFRTRLLSLECPSGEIYDDIEKVDRWNKFITGDNAFILRSDKGDVWIVAISDSPSRSYDETFNPILTTASYSWVEIMKPEDIDIIQYKIK